MLILPLYKIKKERSEGFEIPIPVCTLSPIFSSDIVTDLPFSRDTLAADGKQPPPDGGGGGGTRE